MVLETRQRIIKWDEQKKVVVPPPAAVLCLTLHKSGCCTHYTYIFWWGPKSSMHYCWGHKTKCHKKGAPMSLGFGVKDEFTKVTPYFI